MDKQLAHILVGCVFLSAGQIAQVAQPILFQ